MQPSIWLPKELVLYGITPGSYTQHAQALCCKNSNILVVGYCASRDSQHDRPRFFGTEIPGLRPSSTALGSPIRTVAHDRLSPILFWWLLLYSLPTPRTAASSCIFTAHGNPCSALRPMYNMGMLSDYGFMVHSVPHSKHETWTAKHP